MILLTRRKLMFCTIIWPHYRAFALIYYIYFDPYSIHIDVNMTGNELANFNYSWKMLHLPGAPMAICFRAEARRAAAAQVRAGTCADSSCSAASAEASESE